MVLAGLTTEAPRTVDAATPLVVDADGRGTAGDCDAPQRAFTGIQAAVDAAAPGSTILVCPGTYAEQVAIAKSGLTVRGAGQDRTSVRPRAVPRTVTGAIVAYVVAPIIVVDGATGVTLSGLTVDGSAAEGGVSNLDCPQKGFYVGIHFRNASGAVDATHVTTVQSGQRCSAGIRSESGGGGASNVVVKDSQISRSGDFGVACIGLATGCTVTGSTITGRGSVADQVQSGIAIRAGATATITGNVIRDHTYALAQGVASDSVGIFLVNADPSANPHLLQENTFINNDLNVQRVSTAAAL